MQCPQATGGREEGEHVGRQHDGPGHGDVVVDRQREADIDTVQAAIVALQQASCLLVHGFTGMKVVHLSSGTPKTATHVHARTHTHNSG